MNADRPVRVTGHIEEKRGIYQIILSWTANGTRGRKSISTGLPIKGNKKRAEDRLKSAIEEMEDSFILSPPVQTKPQMLFADYLEGWLEVVRYDLKPTTFGNHQSAVKRTIAPWFRAKGLALNEVTSEDIMAFYASLLTHMKATSVHKYHSHLSCAFKHAVEQHMIETSPMDKVKRPRAERFAVGFLRQSEAIRLFEAVRGHKLELGVILAAFYGLRRGEVVGLRWESIDFEQNTITIEHTVTVAQVDGKKKIVESDSAKNKSSLRTLPLVPQFREVLLDLRAMKERNQELCGRAYNRKEGRYLYTDAMGNRIRPDYLTDAFPEFLVQNGFKRLRFHDLRHSCASLLIQSGVHLKQIQEWLGHSNFKITADAYAHLEYASKIAAAQSATWIQDTSLGVRYINE